MNGDFKSFTIKLPDGYYTISTAVYGQGTTTYRFKVGQQVRYNGLSQGGILAPGDEVEIVRLGSDPSYYIVKLAGSLATNTWMVKDGDLGHNYSLPHWSQAYSPYPDELVDNQLPVGYDEDIRLKRKENGECETCGKKRPMSMFGLSDCSCSPPPPARW